MLNERPEVVIFNGQGVARPRKMGLATHLGILLDVPSIGCAARTISGDIGIVGCHRGDRYTVYNIEYESIGCWLRTREKVRPIFISQG